MEKLILIKTTNEEEIKQFLDKKHISYQIFYDGEKNKRENIFAHYDQAIKNKSRVKELKLIDEIDLDEELNNDGEWWK